MVHATRALFILLLHRGLLAAPEQPHSHACIHDSYVAQVFRNSTHRHGSRGLNQYASPRTPGRSLAATGTAPIRITALYMNSNGGTDLSIEAGMTTALASLVTGTLMPAAIARWTSMLSVVPVAGGLLYTPQCTATYSGGQCASTTAVMSGGASDVTIAVPPAYLGAVTTYDGYLRASTTTAGAGLSATDFAIYVSAKSTTSCAGGTMAYASTIQRDQYDRPTCASPSADCSFSRAISRHSHPSPPPSHPPPTPHHLPPSITWQGGASTFAPRTWTHPPAPTGRSSTRQSMS